MWPGSYRLARKQVQTFEIQILRFLLMVLPDRFARESDRIDG